MKFSSTRSHTSISPNFSWLQCAGLTAVAFFAEQLSGDSLQIISDQTKHPFVQSDGRVHQRFQSVTCPWTFLIICLSKNVCNSELLKFFNQVEISFNAAFSLLLNKKTNFKRNIIKELALTATPFGSLFLQRPVGLSALETLLFLNRIGLGPNKTMY